MNRIVKAYIDQHRDVLSALKGQTIDVSKFPSLESEIPDENLEISQIFPDSELDKIWDNFRPYTSGFDIKPFAEIYGNTTLCLGCSESNLGRVYYFDFDFGCIEMCGSLPEFSKVVLGVW